MVMLTLLLTLGLLAATTPQRLPVRFVREAMRRADISVEKACIYMADQKTGKPKDRALLTRQLNGDGHLRWADLSLLPVRFWQHLGMVILEELGMAREYRRAMVFALALHGQRRMARIAVDERKDGVA